MSGLNEHGQPVGADLGAWVPPGPLAPLEIRGRGVTLRPLRESDAVELYEELSAAPDSLWTYMAFGPFDSRAELEATIRSLREGPGWLPYAIVVDGVARGFASYLRMDPPSGAAEIGSIVFGPSLQRTTPATEALYLMIDHAFASGYRRCEWKCDALNEPSRRAADRLGFTYEGTFRKATHYKGRSRDTAWYSIVDDEWPGIKAAFEAWLDPANFDDDGRPRTSLSDSRLGSVEG